MTGEPEPTFNLIDTPWIPVLRRDNVPDEVSLIDAIARGDEFTQIVGEVPTQIFAIQRLLLAVLHRAVDGPRDTAHWLDVTSHWDATVDTVRRYLQHVRDRFFLFHSSTPFFQVATLRTAKGEVSGLEKLIADVPNGAPYFTTRIGPGLESMPPAEAARWLVHVHAFDPSGIRSGAVGDPRVKNGKVYPIGPGWSGQIGGITVIGETLRETLQLNLLAADEVGIVSGPQDLPPWERPQLTESEEDGPGRPEPRGLIDLYTWQSRRVRLQGDVDGVTGIVLAQGDPVRPQNRQDVEPMTAWRYSEPQTKKFGRPVYMPRLHDPERQFWRGLGALLSQIDAERTARGAAPSRPPAVVDWMSLLRSVGAVTEDRVVRLRATGIAYGSNSSTVEEITDDTLALPAALLGEGAAELELSVLDAIEAAENTVRAVAGLARDLGRAAGGDIENGGPADRAREQFYALVDPSFRDWLLTLSIREPAREAAMRWQQELRVLALDVAEELLRSAGPAAWIGREVRGHHLDSGKAEVWFRRNVAKALPRGRVESEQEVMSL